MFYCVNCGKEVNENQKFCPFCGEENRHYVEKLVDTDDVIIRNEQYNNQKADESSLIAILAIVFSILGGWLGLIFSIIGLVIYKEPQNLKKCKIALGICIAWFILGFILGFYGCLI